MSSPKLIYAHGKTYDISNFINKHPGGENCLKNNEIWIWMSLQILQRPLEYVFLKKP